MKAGKIRAMFEKFNNRTIIIHSAMKKLKRHSLFPNSKDILKIDSQPLPESGKELFLS